MRSGQLIGGKVATPVREMLSSDIYNGVVFHCEDEDHAEITRLAALVLRNRNHYSYRTARRGNKLIVYKDEFNFEPFTFDVEIERNH